MFSPCRSDPSHSPTYRQSDVRNMYIHSYLCLVWGRYLTEIKNSNIRSFDKT